MTRERYRSDPLSEFSEWHRQQPSWYTWIDADYIGYIDPKNPDWDGYAYLPYIIMELIHISKREVWDEYNDDINKKYPLDEHKKAVYKNLERYTNIPTYVMWHPSECDEFVAMRLGGNTLTKQYIESPKEFLDFLDERRKNAIKGIENSKK